MDEKTLRQKDRILDLMFDVQDDLVGRYFDIDSDKLLDVKIEVLTALKTGKNIQDIPRYYDILELLPADGMWD